MDGNLHERQHIDTVYGQLRFRNAGSCIYTNIVGRCHVPGLGITRWSQCDALLDESSELTEDYKAIANALVLDDIITNKSIYLITISCAHSTMDSLSAEMLEHIAKFVNDSDILALRQTSRTLDSKVFNVFADTFLSSRDCFVLDPKRLRNLKAIVSSPSMVRRLRSLTLTVHPLPVKPSILQLAARKDQDHWMDQLDEFELLCDRMYERYYNSVDKPIVVSILRTLKTTGSCKLVLDLTSYRGCTCAEPRMVETVYHDLYHAVVYEAGHEIDFIKMDDHLDVEVATARTTEIPSLQSLSTTIPRTHRVGDPIMRCFQQTLHADMVNFATVLLVRPLMHLQSLNLFEVNLFERTLSTVLSYCAPTIAQLNFYDVLLDSASWQNIFLQLHSTCHRLDRLRLRQVTAGATRGGIQLMFDARLRSVLTEVMWESCEYEFLVGGDEGEYDEAMHDAMVVKTPTSVHNTLALLASQVWNYVGPLFG